MADLSNQVHTKPSREEVAALQEAVRKQTKTGTECSAEQSEALYGRVRPLWCASWWSFCTWLVIWVFQTLWQSSASLTRHGYIARMVPRSDVTVWKAQITWCVLLPARNYESHAVIAPSTHCCRSSGWAVRAVR